jgi:transcriptional regulator with XRE-family HTH domain
MTTTVTREQTVEEILLTLRERGWSDKQIAKTLGTNRSTIWRWRIGLRAPQPHEIVRMAVQGLLTQEPS